MLRSFILHAGTAGSETDVGLVVLKRFIARRELLDRLAGKVVANEVAEHAVRSDIGRHGHLFAAADPDGDGNLGSDAAEPLVAPRLGRTGFAGDGLTAREGGATTGAAGDDALHHLGGRLGKRGVERLFPGGIRLEDGDAGGVLDLLDARRLSLGAAVGDGRVGLGHLAYRDLFGAERDRRIGVQIGLDAAIVGHVDDLACTDLVDQLGETGVGRNGEGACQATRAVVGAAVVLHFPSVEIDVGRAVEVGLRGNAVVQGGKESERLERRARLALRLGSQVEFVLLVIATADKRLYEAGVGVDRNESQLKVVGKAGELLVCRLFRRLLRVNIEGGYDRKAAFEDLVCGIVFQKRFSHVTSEVLVLVHAVRGFGARYVEIEVLRLSGIMLFLRDDAVAEHAIENEVASLDAVFGIVNRIVVAWGLRYADQCRSLGDSEILGALRIVQARCSLDAVGTLAVVNGVEVHLKDLVLRVHRLKLNGDVGLAHLTFEGRLLRLIGEDGVADELLGDGGSAFMPGSGHVDPNCAGDAHQVDAVMLVESLVLSGDCATGDMRSHFRKIDRLAILQIEFSEKRFAVVGVHLRLLGRVIRRSVFVVGQVLQPNGAQAEATDAANSQNRCDDAADEAYSETCLLSTRSMLAFSRS